MTSLDRPIPTIAATSNARNAFGRDCLTTAKGWASRSDLSGFTTNEVRIAHAIMRASEDWLRPFWSPERVAYIKLNAELQRRLGTIGPRNY